MKNSIKKTALVLTFLVACSTVTFAQKFAFVDTEYILAKLPDYNSAQKQLDMISVQWQKEIEAKYTEIDKLYKAYQAEQILLTEEMRKKRENEIITKEKEAKELQKQRFGVDGDLFKKRQELVKPVQDKVYNAIQELATKERLMVVFDKAGSLTMLYTNPKFDKSDEILDAVK
ncbi:MAG: OmpH family outer membrane protein [Bacteroidetes bacterium]|nr:OmpH family outer membrane protein [Bacteroidota bacterium]HET6245514.1 OmpH family outer membrane protein [Bacteroidia bacterium]